MRRREPAPARLALRRVLRLVLLPLVLLLPLAAPAQAKEEGPADPRARALPVGWSEIRLVEHPTRVAEQVAQRIGVTFESLTERHLSINGFPMKLNVIEAKDEDAAQAVYTKMVGLRGGAWFRRQGQLVVETATTSLLAARRVWAWLGLTLGDETTWRFQARVGLVGAHDYMEANPVFNHFLAIEQGKDPDGARQAIRALVEDWTPGASLALLSAKRPWFEARYALRPEPASRKASGVTTVYGFEGLERELGIPYVDLEATVTVRSRWSPEQVAGDAGGTEATAFWPADDPEVKALAERLTARAKTDRERVLALVRFVGLDVRYSGPSGTRWGTKRVIEQRYGQCWDKSDVLITLCRALGIPARQVAGWVPPIEAGHVWAEVRLRDEGWIPVDATTTWLGISQDYIPLYATDDGSMPIVYLRWPTTHQ